MSARRDSERARRHRRFPTRCVAARGDTGCFPPTGAPDLNVLIVDDNASAAELLQELIVLQDHTARCAFTAQEAIETFDSEHFDVALVDLTLPDRPGTDVARHLRQNAQDRPLMLVAISGYGVGDAAGAQAAPLFDHYLQKPIDFDALDRLLANPPAAA